MTTELFNDDPLSDKQLYQMLRSGFESNEECWQAVREAQQIFRENTAERVRREIENERLERIRYAA